MTFSIQIDIPDELLEARYDHVNHARAFTLLEQGRLELLKAIGHPNDSLLDKGLGLVITKVEARYLREIKRGRVTVTCAPGETDGRRLILKQQILNEKGKVCVDAVIESMFMSMELKKGIDLPEPFATAFRGWLLG